MTHPIAGPVEGVADPAQVILDKSIERVQKQRPQRGGAIRRLWSRCALRPHPALHQDGTGRPATVQPRPESSTRLATTGMR
jgi:hypothetical protein